MDHFAYFPQTEGDIKAMLERIGVNSLDDLYSDVPGEFMFKGEYDLPDALSETEVRSFFEDLAKKNVPLKICIYTISVRDFPGDFEVYIRVPEYNLCSDRNGCFKCLDV